MKIQKKILTLLLFVLVTTSCTRLCAQDSPREIKDRLLVEIDHVSFTQVQMESYLAVVAFLAKAKPSMDDVVLTESNWKEKFADFVLDMTIDQEALRSGGYEPNIKMIDQARQILSTKRDQDPALDAYLQARDIEGVYRDRLLTQSLRVEAYRRARQRQASVEKAESGIHAGTRINLWVKELQQRAIVRTFSQQFLRLHE